MSQGKTRGSRYRGTGRGVLVVAFLAVAMPVWTAAAEEKRLVDEVLALLAADVSEEVIDRWLADRETVSEELSADDLVRLTEAGASDALIMALLDRVSKPSAGPPAAEPPSDGRVAVDLIASYRPDFDEEEEPWDLYVYIDGRPVAGLRARLSSRGDRVERRLELPAGSHRLRVARERHRGRGEPIRRWAHMAPEALDFDLTGTGPWRLEVDYHEPRFGLGSRSGPLVQSLYRGDELVESVAAPAPAAGGWTPLCKDEGKQPRTERGKKGPTGEDCAAWAGLWPVAAGAPARTEVWDWVDGGEAADDRSGPASRRRR